MLHECPVARLVDLGVALRFAAGEQRREDPHDGAEHADRVVVPRPVTHDAVKADEPAEPAGVHQRYGDDGTNALALELRAFAVPIRFHLGDPSDVHGVAAGQGVAPARHPAELHGLLGMDLGLDSGCAPLVRVRHQREVFGDREDIRAVDGRGFAEQRQRLVDRVAHRVRVCVDEARRDRGHCLMEDPDVSQCFLGLAPLGDVANRQHEPTHLVHEGSGVRRDELDVRVAPVGPTDPRPDVRPVVPTADVLGQAEGDVLDVVGVDQ